MAERVFARKLEKVGFADVWVGERTPFGLELAALYPLFTSEIIDLMRRLISPERQESVAISVIAKARKPQGQLGGARGSRGDAPRMAGPRR